MALVHLQLHMRHPRQSETGGPLSPSVGEWSFSDRHTNAPSVITTNHNFLRILPKVDIGTNVAFDSERRVLRCDNGVDWMAVIKLSWLYLGFRPESPFFLVIKSTHTFGSTAASLASLQMDLIWLLLNGKYSIAPSIAPLFKWPFLWRFDKKNHKSNLLLVCCIVFLLTWTIHCSFFWSVLEKKEFVA